MKDRLSVRFAAIGAPREGAAVVLAGPENGLAKTAKALDKGQQLERAIRVADFSGKFGATVDVVAPAGSPLDRILVLGTGGPDELDEYGWMRLGGAIYAALRGAARIDVVVELAGDKAVDPRSAAGLALGAALRAYSFDRYKTRDDKARAGGPVALTIRCARHAAAEKAFEAMEGLAAGVYLARDLVNEPANMLGPVEFAQRAERLSSLGVKVEVLGEKEMRRLGMGALLGVAQGSVRPPRLVVMRWNGGKAGDRPVALVGKGVVFDTGGNSMKPASSMEDMRGDVGGAAAVVGAMHAIAARKAKANVVGVIGCVENMVDANAQRPGDIVTSMSRQTIEVLNTDAEGRLVLADAMTYCQQKLQPKVMIDLATLTGAIIVALGQHHAGLFSNDDTLANQLIEAGNETHEKVWRMPLGPEYDKLIDSKNADMKNIGGRYGGAISAAQFLQRFVKDTPWAHLDIAGTAMNAPNSDISPSWASGFGVRLLDRLVRDHYEK